MSIADHMAFLAGAQEEPKPKAMGKPMGEPNPIHEHLKAMHAKDGKRHSHVEHHEDGTHTSHHVGDDGSVSGPHDHENLDALKEHFDQFLNEEGNEDGKERHGEHEGLM